MSRAPHSLIQTFFLAALLALNLGTWTGTGAAVEYAVPNSGSPYQSLKDINENEILHIPTGVRVTLDQMMEVLAGARVIYIGETHDNLEAHRVQLEVLRRLADRFPGKIALGLEMFRRSAQEDLDRWQRGDLTDRELRRLFRNNWGRGYKLYQPILQFCKDRSIPLLGLKSSRESEAALRKGESAPDRLPEMDENDPYHRAYSFSVFGSHGDKAPTLEKPYQMLLLWEESMAQTVAEFLRNPAYPDWKLVVLAGGFHVQYGFGVPKRAFRRVPHAYSIVLPTVTDIPVELKDREMTFEQVNIPLYSADFAWKLPYRVLPDNRIRLGVRLEEEDDGIRVKFVAENSNAAAAGILQDDLLLAMDGQTLLDIEDLVDRLQTRNFGDRTTIRLRRGTEEKDLEVLLSEMEK